MLVKLLDQAAQAVNLAAQRLGANNALLLPRRLGCRPFLYKGEGQGEGMGWVQHIGGTEPQHGKAGGGWWQPQAHTSRRRRERPSEADTACTWGSTPSRGLDNS